MPAFLVRFKGMLTRQERKRLAAASIEIEHKEPSIRIGLVRTGRPIYTVRIAAAAEDEAVRAVKAALEPDAANFSSWEAEPA
ncbi:MAG TPA: hypothetical protein VF255_08990 [Solirubrobacterales bacterium]